MLGPNLVVLDYFTPYDQNTLSSNDRDLGSGGLLIVPDQSGSHPHEATGCGKPTLVYVVDRDNWEPNIYSIGNNDVIKAFHLDPSTGLLSTSPTSQRSFEFVFPGAQPVVSSNGSSNGIVWAVDHGTAAALHACDANDMSMQLYVSSSMGTGAKWAVPTVINGKVYVGTDGHLYVFGLN